ncbi:MAG TPA: hypothetical protein DHV85_22300 [Candidatus Accumulibacter sp.]|nr:hypothetical protein [Accumulibacter sp.]
MNANDTPGLGCSGVPVIDRCAASLPDNPQCAPNYHFGMLLGVADFRAEQGFHVGRLRRHQRLLHGSGVVAGYPVHFDVDDFELHVGAGYAIDALGRDLLLDSEQCVSLPRWWEKHAGDEAFDDIAAAEDATFDLDLVVCYASCLDQPVPAIAEPCAGDAADIAYARVCETVQLLLRRHLEPPPAVPAPPAPYYLLQRWLGLAPAAFDAEGQPLPEEQWLSDRLAELPALPAAAQGAARAALLGEISARAVAATSPFAPAHLPDESDLCLSIARLREVHIWQDAVGWHATIGSVELGARSSLLPGSLLQTLLLAEPPPAAAVAGAVVVASGATLAGNDLTLVFSQKLAAASVQPEAFAVSEFVDGSGWQTFAPAPPAYDESDPARPTVTLTLDRAPVGSRLRISVVGDGSTPLLGANLIPAGAPHPDRDGRTLTTTIIGG